jgi:hypothetical protein
LFAAAIVFGPIVELRSAFPTHRRTDLDVFLRAAWAARTGRDIYTIRDPNGWHFHYLPIFAIAMIPLADPPPGERRAGILVRCHGRDLLVYPLWRRDFRILTACGVGLALGSSCFRCQGSEARARSATSTNGIACCSSRRWAAALIARAPKSCSTSTGQTIKRSGR